MNTRIETIWRDLSPFTVGFDRTFDTLSILANSKTQNTNYPPYNIRKLPEDKYSIELAVAGFDEKDIDIEPETDIELNNKKPSYMALKQDECNATVKVTEKTGLEIVGTESFDVNVCKKEVNKVIN